MATKRARCALIGDLVRSKESLDRTKLQNALMSSLYTVNLQVEPLEELGPTVGDEFQGVFADVPGAVRASLLVRLELLRQGGVDSRYGIGFGPIMVFEDAPRITQDGPAWWSARSAIGEVEEMALDTRTAFLRTRFELPEAKVKVSTSEAAAINAYLVSRDAIVDRMSPRSRRLLLGLLSGKRQVALAKEEGIYQSAVSQNLTQSGAYAIAAAERDLAGVDR